MWKMTNMLSFVAAVNMVNVKTFADSARYIIIHHGGYADAEVDVLSTPVLLGKA